MRNPKVAIVIDDLGADLAHTDRALTLPKTVTLSFLPYAEATPWLSAEALRGGHEILVHMPMQAEGEHDPGPLALTTALPPDEIRARLVAALARVPGAIGINNHMGSKFTADRAALIPVAEELAARHLFFFDSRTTAATQVVEVAHAFGVASTGRDVFLDDEQTADAVGAQLMELESRARAQGIAIAIGHPHDVTLAALAQWTARAGARGFILVPLSEAIRLKTERDVRSRRREVMAVRRSGRHIASVDRRATDRQSAPTRAALTIARRRPFRALHDPAAAQTDWPISNRSRAACRRSARNRMPQHADLRLAHALAAMPHQKGLEQMHADGRRYVERIQQGGSLRLEFGR